MLQYTERRHLQDDDSLDPELGTVLLVTAHPDDEAMFFGPTIARMRRLGHTVHILCLSTGNFEGPWHCHYRGTAANRSARFTWILGLGGVRRAEMAVACKVMGVECTVVNDPSLQDGPNEVWSLQLLSRHIGTGIARTGADTLVTFDDRGVSGHPNHIAVGAGAELAVVESGGGVKVLYLETTTLLRKFSGPLDVLLSTWLCGRMCVTDIDGMRRTYAAMRSHASQWVWYRKLFVPFSRYTYVNTFRATRQGTT